VSCKEGYKAVVKLLLAKNDVDPDSKDKYGQTPLSWAARCGHEAVVKLLLGKDGVDPDSQDTEYGRTPLLWATRNGHEAVVKLPLDNKAGVDAKDSYGLTAHQLATFSLHKKVKQLLIKKCCA
jgi:ankyrin repeat protein